MQVRQDTQLAMTFPFVVFCHYSEQFYVSQAEQFSDCLSRQKQIYEIVKVIHCATLITSSYMSEGYAMTDRKMINTYLVILTLYEQQKYMWDNRVHSVEHRIVSLSQPWIRPIVRGKVKAPTEFGAKFEVILDERGYARMTRVSFEAFNESEKLQEALIKYHERTGRWPKRVLVDHALKMKSSSKRIRRSLTRTTLTASGLRGSSASASGATVWA